MNINQLGLFRVLGQRLDWLTQRQAVLSQNIANADTPGYRPNDLRPFAEHLARTPPPAVQLAATQPGHLAGRPGAASALPVRRQRSAETAPNGNEVVVEQQLMTMGATARDHQMALNLYRKNLGMIRMALGRAGRV